MRPSLFAAIAVAGLSLGQAAAQEAAPVTKPIWLARPTADDVFRVFPVEARKAGIDGRAVIGCRVGRDGTLAKCAVLEETPAPHAFGKAALRLAGLFQMEAADANGAPTAGREVRIPLRLRAPRPAPAPAEAPAATATPGS